MRLAPSSFTPGMAPDPALACRADRQARLKRACRRRRKPRTRYAAVGPKLRGHEPTPVGRSGPEPTAGPNPTLVRQRTGRRLAEGDGGLFVSARALDGGLCDRGRDDSPAPYPGPEVPWGHSPSWAINSNPACATRPHDPHEGCSGLVSQATELCCLSAPGRRTQARDAGPRVAEDRGKFSQLTSGGEGAGPLDSKAVCAGSGPAAAVFTNWRRNQSRMVAPTRATGQPERRACASDLLLTEQPPEPQGSDR